VNLTIADQTELEDGCLRTWLIIPDKEFVVIGFLLESMEGMCNYSTVRKDGVSYMELTISPNYKEDISELLEFFKSWSPK